ARYRSRLAMSVYDGVMNRGSVPTEAGIVLSIPLQGTGYLPVQITFNDGPGMSSWLGREVHFTVDYAVADIPHLDAHSNFYRPEESLYASYIGAYYLQGYGENPLKDPQLASDLAV